MKLATFTHEGTTRVGVVVGNEVVDVSKAAPELPRAMEGILAAGPSALERIRAVAGGGPRLALAQLKLEAPCTQPRKFLAIGLNYADHIAETGRPAPEFPVFFNKQNSCVNGPYDPIWMPRVSDKLDYEGELAFVIGRRCRHVPKARAHEVIAGYLICNDVSVRDWQQRAPTMTLGKSFDTHGPLGPFLVTPDELGDPHGLDLETTVDGERRQKSNTKNLVFDCYDQVETLSTAFTLEPGDVISTGTCGGVGVAMNPRGYLKTGQTVRVTISGLGYIENRVVDEPAETGQAVNGAEALIRTAVASGVEVCFANPGTTEMHLVAALDAAPGMRAVLALFEGVVTGAADGYARMTGKPALTITHLGPGFANGIANLHNARRANTPVVNVIGDQATWHLAADAPLTSDIESLAKPVSVWVRKVKTAAECGPALAEAIAASQRAPGGVATLIVPADCAWDQSPGPASPVAVESPSAVRGSAIDAAAQALRSGEPTLILLGANALSIPGSLAAARVAAKSGARVLYATFPARVERGAGLPAFGKFPYFPEQGVELLSKVKHLVLAGAIEPVAFFGYPNTPSRLTPASCRISVLARPDEDAAAALEALADALRAEPNAGELAPRAELVRATGKLTPDLLGRTLAALQPEGAIVVDEAATSGAPWFGFAAGAAAHSSLGLTGGAIGQGLPNAVGAAIACPDRRVIALQADGSGMYTLQALWTAARESLDLKAIICANRLYRILRVELARADIAQPGPAARALTDLGSPDLDWVSLARGMGVPGERADAAESFAAALGRALATPGPYLIEAVL